MELYFVKRKKKKIMKRKKEYIGLSKKKKKRTWKISGTKLNVELLLFFSLSLFTYNAKLNQKLDRVKEKNETIIDDTCVRALELESKVNTIIEGSRKYNSSGFDRTNLNLRKLVLLLY